MKKHTFTYVFPAVHQIVGFLLNALLMVSVLVCFSCSSTGKKPGPGEGGTIYTVLFAGDILLSHEAKDFIKKNGNDYVIRRINTELRKYDLVFANLETPVTTRGIPHVDKPYVFRISPQIAKSITMMKIDAVTIANNHIMDYGVEGLHDTIAFLRKNNIPFAGAGNNLSEATKPVHLKLGDVDLYVLAYNERPPSEYTATSERAGAAPFDIEIIKSDIRKIKKKDNIVIVTPHWGIEKTKIPKKYQIRAARALIDAGADAVIGHHPHWPQALEVYKKKPIIYSLGNFINGFYNEKEMDNILVAMYFNNNRLQMIKIIPITGKNSEIHFQPYVSTGKQARSLLQLLQRMSNRIGSGFDIVDDKGFIYFVDQLADNDSSEKKRLKIKEN